MCRFPSCLTLQLSRLVFIFQRFPHAYSIGYVIQKFTFVRKISSCLIEKSVAIVFTPTANYSIISFLPFILGQHRVLFIVRKRARVTFRHEVSWGNLSCSCCRVPLWPSHDPPMIPHLEIIKIGPPEGPWFRSAHQLRHEFL